MKKYRKIKNPYTSLVYRNEAIDLALSHAPEIYPCKTCHHPVAKGYVCITCDDDSPEGDYEGLK